ncbi:hypothetical protein QBC35DRAFT_396447 [Podospora australis]|uniref:CCHC-type domain-containing protein n=1 Tax=Podospora australis TaxID=1536484 RepID=A0AAN7ADN6_9PEZI|nr:hypothetical protein QBC35DRAFT_396447 [Podospora australis]
MKHLHESYNDPNKLEDSREKFEKLTYKPADGFTNFRNEFVRLAGECQRPKSDWKYEFNRKLTPSLKTAVAKEYLDKTVRFDEFVRHCQQIADIWTRAQQERSTSNSGSGSGKSKDKDKGKGKATSTTATSSKSSTAPTRTRLSPDEVRILAMEGRCFTCKEKGHVSKDCPQKAADNAKKLAAVNAIVDAYAAKQDKTDAESENN